ncbi:MAG: hypothetical protein CMI55_02800 [Parcubacteria group bacterium]|jgi:spoIIIJ-associated protein|nr:hypothetical protein [Parcubacteria group bacterium]|tara:strand:+ start:607 stop:1071 length:465 start_codon:yes stop_codon:yes gene_type:complete
MNKTDIIKETITELLKTMNFEGEVAVDDSDENNILVNVQTNQAGFLIGQAGTSLDALQYIARVMVNKKGNQSIQFLLDVNDYRKHRIKLLKELARNIAKQTLSEKATITLQPMSAYERRVIHLVLSDNPEVNTESIGQDPERKIVVRPANQKNP